MNKDKVRMITRGAILLAVVVVVQIAGRNLPNSSFIVGPLINMCLLIAAMTAGLGAGVMIAVLSPFASLLNNHAPIASALLPFAPVIAVANVIFVLVFYYLYNKNKYVGWLAAAVLKFGFLFVSIRVFLDIFNFPKFTDILIKLFSWPQLITALIGGFLALPVIIAVRRATQNKG